MKTLFNLIVTNNEGICFTRLFDTPEKAIEALHEVYYEILDDLDSNYIFDNYITDEDFVITQTDDLHYEGQIFEVEIE